MVHRLIISIPTIFYCVVGYFRLMSVTAKFFDQKQFFTFESDVTSNYDELEERIHLDVNVVFQQKFKKYSIWNRCRQDNLVLGQIHDSWYFVFQMHLQVYANSRKANVKIKSSMLLFNNLICCIAWTEDFRHGAHLFV